MDKRLKTLLLDNGSIEAIEYDSGVIAGFNFAIQRLRENKFYGHYAEGLANWLEDHLEQEMPDPTPTRLK